MVPLLSKWRPIGKKVQPCNPVAYPSQCPSCEFLVEGFDHLFRCPDRRKWRVDLRLALIQLTHRSNTNPLLTELLLNGLHHWFEETPHQSLSPFSQRDSYFRLTLHVCMHQKLQTNRHPPDMQSMRATPQQLSTISILCCPPLIT